MFVDNQVLSPLSFLSTAINSYYKPVALVVENYSTSKDGVFAVRYSSSLNRKLLEGTKGVLLYITEWGVTP